MWQVSARVALLVALQRGQVDGGQRFAGGNGRQFLRVLAKAADKEGDERGEGGEQGDGEGFAVHGAVVFW